MEASLRLEDGVDTTDHGATPLSRGGHATRAGQYGGVGWHMPVTTGTVAQRCAAESHVIGLTERTGNQDAFPFEQCKAEMPTAHGKDDAGWQPCEQRS